MSDKHEKSLWDFTMDNIRNGKFQLPSVQFSLSHFFRLILEKTIRHHFSYWSCVTRCFELIKVYLLISLKIKFLCNGK